MDDRVVDFNELKNKVRDKDIDKFESYIYDLYYSVATGGMSMADFTKKVTEYMNNNNISQEKFFNIQKEMLKRYGFDLGDIEQQMKGFGMNMGIPNMMPSEESYEIFRKNIGFQEKYKNQLNIKNINVCKIKNDLNDLEIFLNEKELIIKSNKKVNFKDLELNDFICSYKKTLDDDKIKVRVCDSETTYEY